MAKEKAAVRRARARERDEESIDIFDVPATVLCAFCGQPDCAGCSPAGEDGSGVVTIVPWERPGSGVWTRLWSTASATTLGAETFFASLPDGELQPAVRFALLAETLAIVSMISILAPLALLVLPNVALAIIVNPLIRASVFRWTLLGVPLLAAWMVGAHMTHGAILDVGARREGARPQRRRAFRFGLYACGWDLMAGPLGALVTIISSGRAATRRLLSLTMSVPGRASIALLRGVYGLSPDGAARARRLGAIAALIVTCVTGAGLLALFVAVM